MDLDGRLNCTHMVVKIPGSNSGQLQFHLCKYGWCSIKLTDKRWISYVSHVRIGIWPKYIIFSWHNHLKKKWCVCLKLFEWGLELLLMQTVGEKKNWNNISSIRLPLVVTSVLYLKISYFYPSFFLSIFAFCPLLKHLLWYFPAFWSVWTAPAQFI